MSLDTFFDLLATGTKPSIHDTMKYEALRIASFHTRPPTHMSPSAIKLANAGFYYLGHDNAVACYKCDLKISDWETFGKNVDPLVVHFERGENCAFLGDMNKENIPYSSKASSNMSVLPPTKQEKRNVKVSPLTLHEKPNENRSHQQLLQNENARSQRSPEIQTDDVRANQTGNTTVSRTPLTAAASTTNVINNFGSQTGSSMYSPFGSGYANSTFGNNFGGLFGSANPPLFPPAMFDSSLVPPFFQNDYRGTPNYKDEKTRIDSFNYWPRSSSLRPNELARAGFYYLGAEDRVQCAFCKGVLRNWDATDDAVEEHKKHFPTCPFVKDPKGVGNVPVHSDMKGVTLRKEVASDTQTEEYMLGIMTERAYHPHMAMRVERLNSFVNFRSDSTRTPDEFSEAGFFFTGQGDNVKCFFCDGGLRNWERNDDPWLEHARWFPKCGYLRTKKGEEYVRDIRKRYAPPGTRKPKLRKLKKKFDVDKEKVERIMKSEMIMDVSDMGFNNHQIRTVVERRLTELGSEFPNVESVVDMIYEQEAMNDQDVEVTDEEEEDDEEETSNIENKQEQNDNKQQNTEKAKKKKKKNKNKKNGNKSENAVNKNQVDPTIYMTEEKGEKLQEEVQKMKDERMCKVCMDTDVNIVFLKCGHLVCCSDCAPALRHCPICRQVIRGTIRVFLS